MFKFISQLMKKEPGGKTTNASKIKLLMKAILQLKC